MSVALRHVGLRKRLPACGLQSSKCQSVYQEQGHAAGNDIQESYNTTDSMFHTVGRRSLPACHDGDLRPIAEDFDQS